MERISQEAFITIPNLKNPANCLNEKKQSFVSRQRISFILKSLLDKQLVNQAISNIGMPKIFVDQNYIDSRPQQQMTKIYTTLCALKKEVTRIKRYSQNQQLISNNININSKKKINQILPQTLTLKPQLRQFKYLNKQISPDIRIKKAIQQQLAYRQKLEKRQQRLIDCQKMKKQLIEKRMQVAKGLNKKAVQIYEKQKIKEENEFVEMLKKKEQNINQQIQKSRLENEGESNVTVIKDWAHTQYSTKRPLKNSKQSWLERKIQNQKSEFELYLLQKQKKNKMKDSSFRQFKHQRMSSFNQKVLYRQIKSQQIRQRKINTNICEENKNLRKWIQKQEKIRQHRNQKNELKQSRNSQSLLHTTTNLMTTNNLNRNSEFDKLNSSKQYIFEDQKQNEILQKIQFKNQKRQMILNFKVQQIRQKNLHQQLRRQHHKQSQVKLFTQQIENDSIINPLIKKSSNCNQIKPQEPSFQQKNIKKKHLNVLTSLTCDQTIMRLRKLPKSVLEKKLRQYKNKQLTNILCKNIAKFLS